MHTEGYAASTYMYLCVCLLFRDTPTLRLVVCDSPCLGGVVLWKRACLQA